MTEGKLIQSAQKMDLSYWQPDTRYDLIPHVARSTLYLAMPPQGPHVDGVIGSINPIDDNTQQMWHMFFSKPITHN